MRALLILALLPLPALAQESSGKALSATQFESLVEGRTLTYGAEGTEPYGVEYYHPGRRVTWAWSDSTECLPGTWREEKRPDGPAICFDYDHDPEPKCWRFFREGVGLRATFLNDGGATELYELIEDPGSLVCGGVGA